MHRFSSSSSQKNSRRSVRIFPENNFAVSKKHTKNSFFTLNLRDIFVHKSQIITKTQQQKTLPRSLLANGLSHTEKSLSQHRELQIDCQMTIIDFPTESLPTALCIQIAITQISLPIRTFRNLVILFFHWASRLCLRLTVLAICV